MRESPYDQRTDSNHFEQKSYSKQDIWRQSTCRQLVVDGIIARDKSTLGLNSVFPLMSAKVGHEALLATTNALKCVTGHIAEKRDRKNGNGGPLREKKRNGKCFV